MNKNKSAILESEGGYVFIHCWFNASPEDKGTIRLLYKDAKIPDPRKDDIYTISILPK